MRDEQSVGGKRRRVAESQQGGEKMGHLTSAIKHTEIVPHHMGKCRHLPQWGVGCVGGGGFLRSDER